MIYRQPLEMYFQVIEKDSLITSLLGNKRHPEVTVFILSYKKNFFKHEDLPDIDSEENTHSQHIEKSEIT